LTVKNWAGWLGVAAVVEVLGGCGGESFASSAGQTADVMVDAGADAGADVGSDGQPREDAHEEPAVEAGAGEVSTEAGESVPDASDAACVPLVHENGYDPTGYLSCDPLGTDSAEDALLACQGYVAAADGGSSTTCTMKTFGALCGFHPPPVAAKAVCAAPIGDASADGDVPCWIYAGADQGQVYPFPRCTVTTPWN
jgi:hypothetical protein